MSSDTKDNSCEKEHNPANTMDFVFERKHLRSIFSFRYAKDAHVIEVNKSLLPTTSGKTALLFWSVYQSRKFALYDGKDISSKDIVPSRSECLHFLKSIQLDERIPLFVNDSNPFYGYTVY